MGRERNEGELLNTQRPSVHFHVWNNVLFQLGFVLAQRRIAVCVLLFVRHHMFASSVGFPHSHQRLKINSVRVVVSSRMLFRRVL